MSHIHKPTLPVQRDPSAVMNAETMAKLSAKPAYDPTKVVQRAYSLLKFHMVISSVSNQACLSPP